MDKWRKAFGLPETERVQLGKEVWKIAAEEVYTIGVVGWDRRRRGPIVKTTWATCRPPVQQPGWQDTDVSRPVTFYWKK